MDYPDKWIRGVISEEYLKKGLPKASLFSGFTDCENKSDYEELSINWYDREEALMQILDQKKDGARQFKIGAAIFSREKLDELCATGYADNCYKYERSPTPDNEYHGNLLAKKGIKKEDKKMVASLIAANCFIKLELQKI